MQWRGLIPFAVFILLLASVVAPAQLRSLCPGDSIRVSCPQDPRLNVDRTITTSGTVSIPSIGEVPAVLMEVGRFRALLSAIVEDRLGEDVELVVSEVATKETPVRSEGLTARPYSMKWRPGLSLRQFVAGVTLQSGADRRAVKISHPGGKIEIADSETGDVLLFPGDRVVFGPQVADPVVVVVGPVAHPGPIPAKDGLTLATAIEEVGGLTGHADADSILIVRRTGERMVTSMKEGSALELRAGDSVSVGTSVEQYFVTVEGDVGHPGLLELRKGMTLTQVIAMAGGVKSGKSDAAYIRRILKESMNTTKYSLGRIRARLDLDPVVEPADFIAVGGK